MRLRTEFERGDTMATNILSPKRTKYVSVKEFMEIFSLKQTKAYELVNEPGFPKMRLGEKLIRIPLEEAMEYINKKYN